MTSQELIKNSRERFEELREGQEDFEKEIERHVLYWIQEYKGYVRNSNDIEQDELLFKRALESGLQYQMQCLKTFHWRSFYNGWLEGRMDLYEDVRKQELESLLENQLSKKTDQKLSNLQGLIQDEFDKRYVTIQVCNANGNIASKIKEETGFECYHKYPIQYYTSGRGTNYIKIPAEKYSKKLEEQLIEKYEI